MNSQLITSKHLGSHQIEIHYVRPLFHEMKYINSSETAEEILREVVNPKRIDLKEFFWVILLTNANRLIAISEIGMGCAHGVTINFKEIFQLALITNASGIIVAHNHPSGNLKPSNSDIKMTRKLKTVADIIQITLLDHLIITSEGYLSLSDSQLI